MVQVLSWSLIAIVYFVAALLVLDRLNVPLSSLVAPATVAGVALGFGAQRMAQDMISGFFIFTERQYGYGDVLRIAPPARRSASRARWRRSPCARRSCARSTVS